MHGNREPFSRPWPHVVPLGGRQPPRRNLIAASSPVPSLGSGTRDLKYRIFGTQVEPRLSMWKPEPSIVAESARHLPGLVCPSFPWTVRDGESSSGSFLWQPGNERKKSGTIPVIDGGWNRPDAWMQQNWRDLSTAIHSGQPQTLLASMYSPTGGAGMSR